MKKYRVVLTDYMYETIQPFYDVFEQYKEIEFFPMQLKEKADILRETEYADAVMVHFDQIDKDIISLHLLLNESTRKSIDAAFFKQMKKSAFLINTGRGGLVNENDLLEALRTGEIAGAGLDVLEREGIEKDSPLQALHNVIITPHAAWYTEEAFETLLTSAAQEVVHALHNQPVKNQVNKF